MTLPLMNLPDRFFAIDLECLSLSKRAPILTFGGALIDRTNNVLKVEDSIYLLTSFWKNYAPEGYDENSGVLPDCDIDDLPGRVHEGTYNWWRQQDPEAIREAFAINPRPGQEQVPCDKLHARIYEFLQKNNATDIPVYGFGACFDNAIMEENAFMLGVKDPWTYRNSLCGRTLQRTLNSKEAESATVKAAKEHMRDILGIQMLPHVAVHDAISQGLGIGMTLNKVAEVLKALQAQTNEGFWL